MAIQVRAEPAETRKKLKVPDWKKSVGEFSDKQIADAVAQAGQLDGYLSDPNCVRSLYPPLPRSLTAADLDFGRVVPGTVTLTELIASQNWVKRDRLIWHIEHPGERNDMDSPFTSMPLVAAETVIVDGHHVLSALLLLGVKTVDVWLVPIGLATGHPR